MTQCVWKSEDNSMISGLSFVLTWVLGIELRLPNQISKYPTSADPSGQPNPLVFHFLFIIMSLLLKSQVWWYTPLILALRRLTSLQSKFQDRQVYTEKLSLKKEREVGAGGGKRRGKKEEEERRKEKRKEKRDVRVVSEGEW